MADLATHDVCQVTGYRTVEAKSDLHLSKHQE